MVRFAKRTTEKSGQSRNFNYLAETPRAPVRLPTPMPSLQLAQSADLVHIAHARPLKVQKWPISSSVGSHQARARFRIRWQHAPKPCLPIVPFLLGEASTASGRPFPSSDGPVGGWSSLSIVQYRPPDRLFEASAGGANFAPASTPPVGERITECRWHVRRPIGTAILGGCWLGLARMHSHPEVAFAPATKHSRKVGHARG